jgi:hypothetical protein
MDIRVSSEDNNPDVYATYGQGSLLLTPAGRAES